MFLIYPVVDVIRCLSNELSLIKIMNRAIRRYLKPGGTEPTFRPSVQLSANPYRWSRNWESKPRRRCVPLSRVLWRNSRLVFQSFQWSSNLDRFVISVKYNWIRHRNKWLHITTTTTKWLCENGIYGDFLILTFKIRFIREITWLLHVFSWLFIQNYQ